MIRGRAAYWRAWAVWAWWVLFRPRFCVHCDRATFRRHRHRLPAHVQEQLLRAVAELEGRDRR